MANSTHTLYTGNISTHMLTHTREHWARTYTHTHTQNHALKHLYKVLSKQGSIGKVDKEAPEKYEVIVKQFKRRSVIRKGNNKTNPENFQGML